MKKLSIIFTVMFFIGMIASSAHVKACESNADCDDGVPCTIDTCDSTNVCQFTPNDADCPDDGLFCNGDEFCDSENDCSSTGDPCDEGEVCDEDNDICVYDGNSVSVDIKPGSCPNPLNVRSKGVLPVAVLGTEEFDVSETDLSTIQLAGVSPIRSGLEDVSTPVIEDECACTTEGGDGIDDLTLKFNTQEIVEALGEVSDGDVMVLTLTGELLDGTLIEGEDCIRIINKLKRWQDKLKKQKKQKKPKK